MCVLVGLGGIYHAWDNPGFYVHWGSVLVELLSCYNGSRFGWDFFVGFLVSFVFETKWVIPASFIAASCMR